MQTFAFAVCLFLLAFYFGYVLGKIDAIQKPKEKEYEGCTQKEIDRRKNLSKISKTRKRVNGKFVKE